MRQAVDEDDLHDAKGAQSGPDEGFTEAQAGLAGRAQPELHFERADLDGVAIAENSLRHGLAVDGHQGVGLSGQDEALSRAQVELQMPVPNPVFLQL